MAWHVQRPRGLGGRVQRIRRAAGAAGSCKSDRGRISEPAIGLPQSSCWLTTPPPFPGPLPPPLLLPSASLVFVLPQSRGPSSTPCPARATGSVSPAWTPTRCPPLPHSSWTSCFTPTGRAASGVRGCRVGQGDTNLPTSLSLRGEAQACPGS